ncbi:hypothetical protein V1525DRAFT_408920 [Lipomyces kononenkoae]|uniref:Uncharacterized protein n=1 Tax=Lipomyces kononenkoae TaxID=34357 RepID=A0ACC3SVW4_LIPKO
MSKSLVRSIKNVTNGYTAAQVKVRNATSNESWGPSGGDMDEIAQLTFDDATLFEVMEIMDKRLNDKGKNWRHVMKALVLLDYCLHVGSENVVRWAKDNQYIIKTLREFQYIDEESHDQGANIRAKAKELTLLLHDDDRMRTERANRNHMRDKMSHSGDDMFHGDRPVGRPGRSGSGSGANLSARPGRPDRRRRNTAADDENDADLQRAIEESKATAQEEETRRRARNMSPVDDDLAAAIRQSQRIDTTHANPVGSHHQLQKIDEGNLIDIAEPQPQQPSYLVANTTGYISPQYTVVGTQQQQMSTGAVYQPAQPTAQAYLPSSQYQMQVPTSFAPQQTGMLPPPPQLGMQPTGYGFQSTKPEYTRQAAPLAADFTGAGFGGYSNLTQSPVTTGFLTSAYSTPPTGYGSNPQSATPTGYGYVQQPPQQQQQQHAQQPMLQAMFQQQYQQQQQQQYQQEPQTLMPQPTGRNNPFAR